jgi:hypothetical protein
MAWVIGKVIDKTMGFRISADDEVSGIDLAEHAETGYDLAGIHASLVTGAAGARTADDPARTADDLARTADDLARTEAAREPSEVR